MNLATVMQEVATRLATITGLRAYGYPPDVVTPPAAVVSWPETLTYDESYARGFDHLELPVVVLVGKVSDRATQTNLGRYADGSGSASIKAVLEGGTYSSFESLRVMRVDFDVVSVAAVDHAAAIFTVDVIGKGT